MKEELTREVIGAMKKCKNTNNCILCIAHKLCKHISSFEAIETLATALLEEMDKPKVWDGAPEWATLAEVLFIGNGKSNWRNKCQYTRELPKTRARIMAEEIASAKISNEKDLVDIIEQTINTHMKELKGGE